MLKQARKAQKWDVALSCSSMPRLFRAKQMYVFIFCCSSICWSSYHKGLLASSDYEGTVTLWDAFTGSKTRSFQVQRLSMMMVTTTPLTSGKAFAENLYFSQWLEILAGMMEMYFTLDFKVLYFAINSEIVLYYKDGDRHLSNFLWSNRIFTIINVFCSCRNMRKGVGAWILIMSIQNS